MNKIKNILIVLMILSSIGIASAQTVISRDIIKSQYGSLGDLFGIGDRLYVIKYSDGSADFQLVRSTLQKLSITSIPTTNYVSTTKSIDVPITISGISSSMDGQTSHKHEINVYDTVTSGFIKTFQYNISSDAEVNVKMTFDKLSAGTYLYTASERVYVKTAFVSVRGSQKCSDGSYSTAFWNIKDTFSYICDVAYLPHASDTVAGTVVYVETGATVLGNSKMFSITATTTPITVTTTPITVTTTPITVTTPQPTPPPSGDCPSGSLMIDDKCAKVIPQLPGFEGIFVIIGMFIVFLLRRKT